MYSDKIVSIRLEGQHWSNRRNLALSQLNNQQFVEVYGELHRKFIFLLYMLLVACFIGGISAIGMMTMGTDFTKGCGQVLPNSNQAWYNGANRVAYREVGK